MSFGIESLAAQPGIAHTELFSKIQPEAAKPVGSAMVRALAIAIPVWQLYSLFVVYHDFSVSVSVFAIGCYIDVSRLPYAHNTPIWNQHGANELATVLFNDAISI